MPSLVTVTTPISKKSYQFEDREVTPRLEQAWNQLYIPELNLRDSLNDFELYSIKSLAYKIELVLSNYNKLDESIIERCFLVAREHLKPFKKTDAGRNAKVILIIFHMLKSVLPSNYQFKYNDMSRFLQHYEILRSESNVEKRMLMEEANWINILANFFPAANNKGIYLESVTKFIEGADVKYITGSGQKPSTARRVALYATECLVQPKKKPKRSKMSSSFTSESEDSLDLHDSCEDGCTSNEDDEDIETPLKRNRESDEEDLTYDQYPADYSLQRNESACHYFGCPPTLDSFDFLEIGNLGDIHDIGLSVPMDVFPL